MDLTCPACGCERSAPLEALGEQSVFVCLECGWVNIWANGVLRVPTGLELEMLSGFPPVAVEMARGAAERQKRIMAAGNA